MTAKRRIDEMVGESAKKLASALISQEQANSEVVATASSSTEVEQEEGDAFVNDSSDPTHLVSTADSPETPGVTVPPQTADPITKRIHDKEIYAQQKAEEARVLKEALAEAQRVNQQLQLSLIQQQLSRQAPSEPEDLTDEQLLDRKVDQRVEQRIAALGLNPAALNVVSDMGEWAIFASENPDAMTHPLYQELIAEQLKQYPEVKKDRNGYARAWNYVKNSLIARAASPSAGQPGAADPVKPKTTTKTVSTQRQEQIAMNAAKLAATATESAPTAVSPKRTVDKNTPVSVQIHQMVANSFDKDKGLV